MGNFFSNLDMVGWLVLLVLLLMSVCSWVVIVRKWTLMQRTRNDVTAATQQFWQAANWKAAVESTQQVDRDGMLFELVDAASHRPTGGLATVCTPEQQITRVLREALSRSSAKLQAGQTVLATVGSVAPFVGLFGTVWGVYHALTSIALAGQIRVDQVSGPVGEALIMTAAGLAVAIPAVVAYNFFGRNAAEVIEQLQGFARDVREMLLSNSQKQST